MSPGHVSVARLGLFCSTSSTPGASFALQAAQKLVIASCCAFAMSLICFVMRSSFVSRCSARVSTPSSCFFSAFAFDFAAFALPMTPDRFRSSRWAGAHGSAARCKSRDKPRPRTPMSRGR
jgi:hypothetical protein